MIFSYFVYEVLLQISDSFHLLNLRLLRIVPCVDLLLNWLLLFECFHEPLVFVKVVETFRSNAAQSSFRILVIHKQRRIHLKIGVASGVRVHQVGTCTAVIEGSIRTSPHEIGLTQFLSTPVVLVYHSRSHGRVHGTHALFTIRPSYL